MPNCESRDFAAFASLASGYDERADARTLRVDHWSTARPEKDDSYAWIDLRRRLSLHAEDVAQKPENDESSQNEAPVGQHEFSLM